MQIVLNENFVAILNEEFNLTKELLNKGSSNLLVEMV